MKIIFRVYFLQAVHLPIYYVMFLEHRAPEQVLL